MKRWMLIAALALFASNAFAAITGDELWIIVAGRVPGVAGSTWVTDLDVTNASEDEVEIEIAFLERGTGAGKDARRAFTIAAGGTLTLLDVVRATFGKENAMGAIHIRTADAEEDLFDRGRLAAQARIYQNGAAGTFGQSFEGMTEAAAVSAEDETVTATVTGARNGGDFRSNWFAVNLSEDDHDVPQSASVLVEVVNASGQVLGSKTYSMPPAAPVFFALGEIAPSFDNASVRFTMTDGEAFFGASLIDSRTNDPATLEASLRRPAGDFTDEFATEDCTFSISESHPFFSLEPGARLVLEGEEDGETVRNTIEVLNETKVVGGVTTRVIRETETVDGELAEISRNYFALCEETGSVFYFGEDVDIYEDGEIVSHDGAWLAGQNGARAGIIMPGEVLAGSRYFQEVAPGAAMDRAEHLETDVTIETPAGTFDGCVVVRDSSPLDPSLADVKVYCRGIGLVKDQAFELVEREEP